MRCRGLWWLCLVLTGAIRAQPQTNLAGQMDLPRLVDLAAQRLRVNVEYDASVLKGSVTLRFEGAVSDPDLWNLLNRALAERGYTTVRTGDLHYAVVKLTDAQALTPLVQADQLSEGPSAGYLSVVVRAVHRTPKDIAEAMSKVLSKPSGSAVPLGDAGLILVSDLAPRVQAAIELARLIDTPAQQSGIEEVPVQNLPAQAIATLVTQVSAKREAVTGEKAAGEVLPSPNGNSVLVVAPRERMAALKELIQSLDKRERVETASYSPRMFSISEVARLVEQTVKDLPGSPPDNRWRLVADELTGSLIVTATPTQHERIRALIARLDAAPAASQRPLRSFVIKNRPVKEIQAVLEELVNTGALEAASNEPIQPGSAPTPPGLTPWPPTSTTVGPPAPNQTPQPAGRAGATHGPPGGEPFVSFTSDEATNTLIVLGDPAILSHIDSLLKALDVRQPQVMLEVLILSLSESQTLDLGVELTKLIISGDTRIRLASLFGLSSRGPNGDPGAPTGSGFTGIVLSPGDFSVVLRALQTLNNGRSLSMPQMLVANNKQATFDAILTQPYASTNASNTVTTTSFGGSQDAGTQVTLKPQIAPAGVGDYLNLEYQISLSAFVGAAPTPNLPPPRQQNKVQSAASLPDGYTVVVGGIDLTTEGRSTSQIPGLGAIPVIGEAFKSRNRNSGHNRFFVFIRANILRSSSFEDLKYVSDTTTSAVGVDDGFPDVEPRVIR